MPALYYKSRLVYLTYIFALTSLYVRGFPAFSQLSFFYCVLFAAIFYLFVFN